VLANKRLWTLFWVWVSAGVRCRMGTNMGEWLQQQVKWVWVWVGFTIAEMNMGTIWVWVYTVPRHSKRPFDPSLPMFKGTDSPIAGHTCTCCCAAAIARWTARRRCGRALHTLFWGVAALVASHSHFGWVKNSPTRKRVSLTAGVRFGSGFG
jgi:hypothetical protein